MMILESIKAALFSEEIWFRGSNLTWEDYKITDDGIQIIQPEELWLSFFIIPITVTARLFFYRYVGKPLGRYMRIPDVTPKAPYHPTLEAVYKCNKNLTASEIKQSYRIRDMNETDVAKWLRKRKKQEKPSSLLKFTESLWKCSIFLLLSLFGIYTFWNEDWVTNTDRYFENFPRQHITNEVYWYGLTQFGFFMSLVITVHYDIRRSDFIYLVIHHYVTVGLGFLVLTLNIIRVGCMILVMFDISDFLLEASKCIVYTEKRKLIITVGLVFIAYWVLARLIITPFKIYPVLWRYIQRNHPAHNAFHFLFACFSCITVLNFYWTFLIFKAFLSSLKGLSVKKKIMDPRSSDEDDSRDENKIKRKRAFQER